MKRRPSAFCKLLVIRWKERPSHWRVVSSKYFPLFPSVFVICFQAAMASSLKVLELLFSTTIQQWISCFVTAEIIFNNLASTFCVHLLIILVICDSTLTNISLLSFYRTLYCTLRSIFKFIFKIFRNNERHYFYIFFFFFQM